MLLEGPFSTENVFVLNNVKLELKFIDASYLISQVS